MSKQVNIPILQAGGTAAELAILNPIGFERQLVFETDTLKAKLLDGVTPYNDLSYFVNPSASTSPLTTKGDIYTFSTTNARLGVGTDGQVLTALGTEATGLLWKTLTTADIADSLNRRYVLDAQLTVIGNTSGTNTGDETNATIKTKLGAASGSQDGYLTSTDWSTFNGKQNALTLGNLTETASSILTITGGTGAIVGSGLTIQVAQASGSTSGYLSSTDWTTFNNKGNVSKVGTPADNQLAIWTGDGTIEGTSALTYNGTTFASTAVTTITTSGSSATLTLTNSGSGTTLNIANSGSGNFLTVDTSKFIIHNTGYISIGTTVSNRLLTMYTTGNNCRIQFINDTTGTALTDGTFLGLDDGINFSFWQREAGYIRFGTNETTRLIITGGGLVAFAGSTSSFPALKRSSADLQVRLADDSGYTWIDVLGVKVSGTSGYSGNVGYTDNLGATKTATFVNGILTGIA